MLGEIDTCVEEVNALHRTRRLNGERLNQTSPLIHIHIVV